MTSSPPPSLASLHSGGKILIQIYSAAQYRGARALEFLRAPRGARAPDNHFKFRRASVSNILIQLHTYLFGLGIKRSADIR